MEQSSVVDTSIFTL